MRRPFEARLLLSDILAGLANGVLLVILAISFGALIFSGGASSLQAIIGQMQTGRLQP